MSTSLADLKSSAARLPLPERAELAQYLLYSLDESEAGAADAWQLLAEQRLDEVKSGQVIGIPSEQVMESLRRADENANRL